MCECDDSTSVEKAVECSKQNQSKSLVDESRVEPFDGFLCEHFGHDGRAVIGGVFTIAGNAAWQVVGWREKVSG